MTMSVFESVMRSPSVWTGKDGVDSLDKLLSNPGLQDKIQTNLIRDSYDKLVATGGVSVPGMTQIPQIGTVLSGSGLSSIGAAITEPLKGAGSMLSQVTGPAASQLGGLVGNLGSTFNSLASSLPDKIGQFKLASIIEQGDINSLSGIGASLSKSLASVDLGGLGSAMSQAAGSFANLSGNVNFSGLGASLNQSAGTISALANRGISQLGGLLNNTSKVGLETATQWAKGLTPDGITTELDKLAKQSQFAVNFSDFKIPNVVSGIAPAAAFEGTVNRSTLDSTLVKLIGTNKVPVPDLGVPAEIPLSFESMQPAINSATSLLKSSASGLGQIPALPGGLSLPNAGLAQQAQSLLRGGVIPIPGLDLGTASKQLNTALQATSRVNTTGTATTDPLINI